MTSPVLTTGEESDMSFLMPSEHKNVDTLPKPTDSSVKLKHVPESIVAVVEFSGKTSDEKALEHFQGMKHFLKKNDLLDDKAAQNKMTVAYYNPPWIPGFLRRNEVWLNLGTDKSKI